MISPAGKGVTALGIVAALLLAMALSGYGCSSSGSLKGKGLRPERNPFGVMTGGEGLTLPQRVSLAGELGVPFFRPRDVGIDTWKGESQEMEGLRAAGLKLVYSVRNRGPAASPPAPSAPPADLDRYRQTLGDILDRYPPDLLAVEDEEDLPENWSGTPEQYGVELKAASETAHSRGISCTNGGLSCDLVVALTWDHYRGRGMNNEADDFLGRAAGPGMQDSMKTEQGRARVEYSIRQGKRFLEQYRAAGIDYVNFHWFVKDARALAEVVSFLRDATGLRPVCNEMGQRGAEPDTVTDLLRTSLDLGLAFVIWYSVDTPATKALQNPDATLRDNGRAFQAFTQKTF
jgi:hypothetical protein